MKHKFTAEIEINFEDYSTQKLNKKAIQQCKAFIKDILESQLDYIPIEIEKNEYDYYFDDSTSKTKIKLI